MREALLAGVAGNCRNLCERGTRLIRPRREHVVIPNPYVGRDEIWIQRQRLLVRLDRFVEAPHLHEQLRVGIVRVGIVGNQLDVLLERSLRVRQLVEEPIGVAKLIVGLRERRIDRRRLDEVLDGRLVLLAAEKGVAEQRMRAFVVRKEPNKLGVVRQHDRRVAFHRRFQSQDDVALAFADLSRQRRRSSRRLDEVLRRSRRIGKTHVAERELRILADGLLVEGVRVGCPKLLREVASLQIELARLLRCRRDGNLVRGWSGLPRRRSDAGAERENERARDCPLHWCKAAH